MTASQAAKTRCLHLCIAALCFVGCASAQQAPEPSPTLRIRELSERLLQSESSLKTAIVGRTNVEERLAATYESLQLLCKAKFDALDQDQERYSAAEARTQVLGGLITLLGSVTSYAPGKTVLTGIGLTSSNSGTVSSGITQFFSRRSTTSKEVLTVLKNQLELTLDRYDSVDPAADVSGTRRMTILARAKGICLGLSPSNGSAKPPETPASAASGVL
jgi:hypothetical protein